MEYFLLLVGFVLLIKGADFFVDGSSSLARLLRVPSVVIGLTIVALGTSAPEAAVSITASLNGNNDIALSNIIGSNIFNLLAVVGVCAAFAAFTPDKTIMKRDFPICLGATVLLGIFMLDGVINIFEGIVLLALTAAYIFVMVKNALANRTEISDEKPMKLWKCLLLIVGGLAAIIIGGNLVVDNASLIAANFGLSDSLIGLTIVAIGTSLPELVTSIAAARKGNAGLALGNVIGSNIFNILFILGASSALSPVNVAAISLIDIVFLAIITASLFIYLKIRGKADRLFGITCIISYIAYTSYIIIR